MTLAEATPVRSYRIAHLSIGDDSALAVRLRQLGFVPGIQLTCEAVAPLLRNPFLFRIRGMSVALARHEAMLIHVEEVLS